MIWYSALGDGRAMESFCHEAMLLVNDDMMYYAVVKNIEIIDEAANMLTAEFQETHPNTPWKKVKGMRNYIVHEYFQIDDIVVWEVATKSLVELKEQISRYLEETDWDKWEEKNLIEQNF